MKLKESKKLDEYIDITKELKLMNQSQMEP